MEKQASPLRPAKITIGKERLNIQTDLTDQELDSIVDFISQKFEKYVGENTNETTKRLLLMALDISAEYFDVLRKYKSLSQKEKNAEREISMLNELLSKEIDSLSENSL